MSSRYLSVIGEYPYYLKGSGLLVPEKEILLIQDNPNESYRLNVTFRTVIWEMSEKAKDMVAREVIARGCAFHRDAIAFLNLPDGDWLEHRRKDSVV